MANLKTLLKKSWRALPFTGSEKPLVTVLDFKGMIGSGGTASRRTINYAKFEQAIEAAFKPDSLSAVALCINSPGGSPVQSRLIHKTIRRLADKKSVPVLAYIEDIGTSAGYMIASAADEVFADDGSIVGSIGVITQGFGFHELMSNYGIERRVYTAGENKAQLDPFKPENPKDVAHLQNILDGSFAQFAELVKQRRGARVETDHDDTFTGAFWLAPEAKERGLIDGMAQMKEHLQGRFGDEVVLKKCTPGGGSLISRLTGAATMHRASEAYDYDKTKGASYPHHLIDTDDVLSAITERTVWSRYGL